MEELRRAARGVKQVGRLDALGHGVRQAAGSPGNCKGLRRCATWACVCVGLAPLCLAGVCVTPTLSSWPVSFLQPIHFLASALSSLPLCVRPPLMRLPSARGRRHLRSSLSTPHLMMSVQRGEGRMLGPPPHGPHPHLHCGTPRPWLQHLTQLRRVCRAMASLAMQQAQGQAAAAAEAADARVCSSSGCHHSGCRGVPPAPPTLSPLGPIHRPLWHLGLPLPTVHSPLCSSKDPAVGLSLHISVAGQVRPLPQGMAGRPGTDREGSACRRLPLLLRPPPRLLQQLPQTQQQRQPLQRHPHGTAVLWPQRQHPPPAMTCPPRLPCCSSRHSRSRAQATLHMLQVRGCLTSTASSKAQLLSCPVPAHRAFSCSFNRLALSQGRVRHCACSSDSSSRRCMSAPLRHTPTSRGPWALLQHSLAAPAGHRCR